MAENTERAKFSLADGLIEIEGSEVFVATQLEKLGPLLKTMFEHRHTSHAAAANGSSNSGNEQGVATGDLIIYQNLFALADGKVQILQSLPGKGKSGKTLSAALLLTYANELNGVKSTTVEEIRSICTSHACYDATNFAKTFKGVTGKASFTTSGTGGAQTVTLTHPGKGKAKALADSLNK